MTAVAAAESGQVIDYSGLMQRWPDAGDLRAEPLPAAALLRHRGKPVSPLTWPEERLGTLRHVTTPDGRELLVAMDLEPCEPGNVRTRFRRARPGRATVSVAMFALAARPARPEAAAAAPVPHLTLPPRMAATTETWRRLRPDNLAVMLRRRVLTADQVVAAYEIRDLFEAIACGLDARATDYAMRVDGGGRSPRHPVDGLSPRLCRRWKDVWCPWANWARAPFHVWDGPRGTGCADRFAVTLAVAVDGLGIEEIIERHHVHGRRKDARARFRAAIRESLDHWQDLRSGLRTSWSTVLADLEA
ncbi:hypothetical protein [Oceanibacterium hippocampi]|uniref:Uncharacterized protein n=1 Tax=Oceanibacterium hippocampi TaxID=745714 RepID=A0A1Y5TZ00_9PROT|nr:hypothetical protein [Oceanibacterium hippocampi]SLN77281.1 hypothetical protein OCH7691_04371 [Oceanibacterium hippocampi]